VCTVGKSLAVDCKSSMQVIKLIAEKVYGHREGRVIDPHGPSTARRGTKSALLDDAEA
jgi:hypothetical protein